MVLVAGTGRGQQIPLLPELNAAPGPFQAQLEFGQLLVGAGQVGVDVEQSSWVFNRFGDLAGALQVLNRLSMLPTVVIETPERGDGLSQLAGLGGRVELRNGLI